MFGCPHMSIVVAARDRATDMIQKTSRGRTIWRAARLYQIITKLVATETGNKHEAKEHDLPLVRQGGA